MKQSMWGVIAAAVASVAIVVALQAQEHRLAATPAHPAGSPVQEAGTVVYTFPDEATMQTFATLWQQRQAMLTKLAVLEGYWKQEQGSLAQLNQQLLVDYHLDVSHSYTLDRDRRVLLERAAPPSDSEPPTAVQPSSPPLPPPTP